MPIWDRRHFLQISGAATIAAAMPGPHALSLTSDEQPSSPPSKPGWFVYIDPRLGTKGKSYHHQIVAAATTSMTIGALAHGSPPLEVTIPTSTQLAYNHVIVVALPDDPLLMRVWQREALIQGAERTIYAFGFGHLQGSIGYLEADRNPFLHAASVAKAPYECECITLTGTDQSGVELAVNAFLKYGLVNGLVAAHGWKRTAPTLLDRDPLPPEFTPPAVLPGKLGPLQRIALTQTAEDEYRSVLADTGIMPLSIWQAKYYAPGEWEASGQIASFHHYATGLHRRAYGNSVWAASFASPAAAAAAASHIAVAAKLKGGSHDSWTGELPPYAWGIADMGDGATTGTLELRRENNVLLLLALSSSV